MRHLLALLLLPLALAAGVVIENRDLNVVNGNIYVDNNPVLTTATNFSSSTTSDVSVEGTYNSLTLTINPDTVGPTELVENASYAMNELNISTLLRLNYLDSCLLATSSGQVGCATADIACSLCDTRFVNTTGGDTMEAALTITTLTSDNTSTDANEMTDPLYLYNPNTDVDHVGILTNKDYVVFYNPTTNTKASISALTGLFAGTVSATLFSDVENSTYYLDPSSTGTSLKVAGDIVAGGIAEAKSFRTAPDVIEILHRPYSSSRGNFLICSQDGTGRVEMYWNVQQCGSEPKYTVGGEPAAKILLHPFSEKGFVLYYAPEGTVGGAVNFVERFRVDLADNYVYVPGKLGVGKTPVVALDVNGDINASGIVYSNNNPVLTTATNFSSSTTSDVSVEGTYNSLTLTINPDIITSSHIANGTIKVEDLNTTDFNNVYDTRYVLKSDTFSGDVTGTYDSTKVGGILGYALPALSTGALYWNGSQWVFQTVDTNPDDDITGSGTAGYIPRFASSSSLEDSIIYDTGSAVGIGTTTPSEKLHVEGNVYASYVKAGSGMCIGTDCITSWPSVTGSDPIRVSVSGTQYNVSLGYNTTHFTLDASNNLALSTAYATGSAYDTRFVNEGQTDSITSSMIINGTIRVEDLNTEDFNAVYDARYILKTDSFSSSTTSDVSVEGTYNSLTLTINPDIITSSHIANGTIKVEDLNTTDFNNVYDQRYIQGSGTVNYVPIFTDGKKIGSSDIYYSTSDSRLKIGYSDVEALYTFRTLVLVLKDYTLYGCPDIDSSCSNAGELVFCKGYSNPLRFCDGNTWRAVQLS